METFRVEEKKMAAHPRLEAVATKFWAVLKKDEKSQISKIEYCKLFQRIYKLLVPTYRADEIHTEVEDEWHLDCKGLTRMNFRIFTKSLYRIAHHWCIHIDLDEYVEFLQRVYDRVTCKKIIRDGAATQMVLPIIQVEFPADELKVVESGGRMEKGNDGSEWLECKSDESADSDFEYKYEEDEEKMELKKYKRAKNRGPAQIVTQIKDPFIYSETTHYHPADDEQKNQPQLKDGDVLQDALAELDHVVPFGRPTEQYLTKIKNDVYEVFAQHAARDQKLQNLGDIGDTGAIPIEGKTLIQPFKMVMSTPKTQEVETRARISDMLYDNFRKMLKDAIECVLRLHNPYPKPGSRKTGSRARLTEEPIQELSKVGYNCAMDRQIQWQFFQGRYVFPHEDLDEFIETNIQKQKGNRFLVYKEQELQKKEEERVHEMSFKQMKSVMLNKKFESFFHERSRAVEPKEGEEEVEGKSKKKEKFVQKPIADDKSNIAKRMHGPMYHLESRVGMIEDEHIPDYDIMEKACTPPNSIIIFGKPRCGKTTLAQNLARELDLVLIDVPTYINQLLEKIKNYEPPEDLEEGQEPPKFLTDFESGVERTLRQGGSVDDDQIVEILIGQMDSAAARTKGFVVDVPFCKRHEPWAKQKELFEREFSHFIELICDDADATQRAAGIREDPEDAKYFSKWERDERRKPKPKPEGEEEEEAEEDDENKPKIFDEYQVVARPGDSGHFLQEELHYYNQHERPSFDDHVVKLSYNQYLRIDSAGLTPEQLTDSVVCRIKGDRPLRPLAVPLEADGDLKALLTQGMDEQEVVVPRQWSLWNQTDPVALFDGKVQQGTPDFAASYNNNVFLFVSEENQKRFVESPNQFVENPPEMPGCFRMAIYGPKGCGRGGVAEMLSQTYGWKVIDVPQLIRKRIKKLKEEKETKGYHVPNNPDGGRIGLAEQQLDDVLDGKPLHAWKLQAWILDELGIPLMKRPPPPPEEKPEGEEGSQPPSPKPEPKKEDKKKADKKQEEEKKEGEEGEPEEEKIVIEDLPIEELAPKVDEETGKAPFVGGFIMLNYPESEEQLGKLKIDGIEFDKVLFLMDQSEEPGTELRERIEKQREEQEKNAKDKKKSKEEDLTLYDVEAELENTNRVLGLLKEQLGEEIVKEISMNATREEILVQIDPFFQQVDNPDAVKNSGELDEEAKPLPKGAFGDYCPVTFVKESWLVPGNKEIECSVKGKTYWCAGEKEQEEFKQNPMEFIFEEPTQPPMPHIMLTGPRGSGVTTQQGKLCEKYKLDEFMVKESYMKLLTSEKDKRKRRRLLDRGFKPLPPAEEDAEEPPVDPEIEDDPEDFDKAEHEKQVMKDIFDASKGQVQDGQWFDVSEEAVTTPYQELLLNARRLPEVMVVFSISEKKMLERLLDNDGIKAEYEQLCEKRAEEKKKARDEAREEKLKELQGEEEKQPEDIENEMKEWEAAQDEADQEEDPEAPNLENMLEESKTKLVERWEADKGVMEEFVEAIKGMNVPVIELSADGQVDKIFLRLDNQLKQVLTKRQSMFERAQVMDLTPKEVPFYENSHVYKQSKYGRNSCLDQANPIKSKEFSCIYRDKIYYFADQEEKEKFIQDPHVYVESPALPPDVNIQPQIFILGPAKSGKSELCKRLSEKTGIVHLKVSTIVEFGREQYSVAGKNIRGQLEVGKPVSDDLIISLLLQRIQLKDCYERGFILEGFPKTLEQAQLLSKKMVPNLVFYVETNLEESFKRTASKKDSRFGANRIILAERTQKFLQNSPEVFYEKNFENVRRIDGHKSKWFMDDAALCHIQKAIAGHQNFVIQLQSGQDITETHSLTLERLNRKGALSEFAYFCPVSWKNDRLLVNCRNNTHLVLEYGMRAEAGPGQDRRGYTYFFKNEEYQQKFKANPKRFINATDFPKEADLPRRIAPHKASEITIQEKNFNGYCPVTLVDEQKLKEGDPLLLVFYKDLRVVFASERKLQKFLQNPFKYAKAELPTKLPPPDDKTKLYDLAQLEDTIPFQEEALGKVVTKALREVGGNRVKYPKLSVKETQLKLFALYLKANNPTNFRTDKYKEKLKTFLDRCNVPKELQMLAKEKTKDKDRAEKGKSPKWNEYKEKYYNEAGAKYDKMCAQIEQEKMDNFMGYVR